MEDTYIAEYSVLIDGAVWGREEHSFYAENEEEARKEAHRIEEEYSSKRKELLLDYIWNNDGDMIEVS